MAARLLEGAPVAAAVEAELTARVEALALRGIRPGLATVLVGDDPASAGYVRRKHEACARVGIRSVRVELPGTASTGEVLDAVAALNADPAVHGFLVQLPLPRGVDEDTVLAAIDPAKDADGLHPANLGRLVAGRLDGPLPCTPVGIQRLLVAYDVPIEGAHVVIVGRGLTVGRPLALLLSAKAPHANAAVTVVHSRVPDLGAYVRQGDVVVAAAGSPGLVHAGMVKPGAAVVGAGISWEGRRILSDVAEDVAEVAGWVTPRLGGVGPMTVGMLLANAVGAAERVAGA